MAEAVGSVRIDLFANLAEFDKGLSKAQGQLRRFSRDAAKVGKSLESAGSRLSIGITAPVVAFTFAAKNAARDAAELQSAFDVSFGEMSDSANDWAAETGKAVGRSNLTLKKAAFEFQQLFKQMAPTEEAAFSLSSEFAELSLDVASFLNLSDDQALQKLRSGLAGEAEPLRRLGVFINEAAVQQKAFQLGLAETGTELTDQQKVLARAVLIMEQLKTAQGDLIRTSASLANQERATQDEIRDLLVTVGNDLQPIFLEVLETVRDVVKAFNSLDEGTRKNILQFALFAAAVGPVLLAVGSLLTVLGGVARVGTVALAAVRGMSAGFAQGVAAANASTAANTAQAASSGAVAKGAVTATRALGLLAVAYYGGQVAAKAGQAAGDAFFHSVVKNNDELSKAALLIPKFLGGAGASWEEATQRVDAYRRKQQEALIATIDATKAQQIQARLLAGDAAGALRIANEALTQTAAAEQNTADEAQTATQKIEELVKGFGDLGTTDNFLKDHASDLERINSTIDPVGQALKEYQTDLKVAAAAGLDMGQAQRALAREMVDSLGGFDAVKDKLGELPPVFREVSEELRLKKFAEDNAAALDELRAAVDPVSAVVAEFDKNLELASFAGLNLSEAALIIARDAVEAAGGVEALGANVEALPPIFKDAIDAIKLDDKIADLKKLAESLNAEFGGETALEARFQDINQLLSEGAISVEVYGKALDDLFKDDEAARKQKDALKDRERTIRQISDGISDAVLGTREWNDVFKDLISQMLRSQVIQPFIENSIGNLFGGPNAPPANGGGGLNFGGFDFAGIASTVGSFFGFRAGGGPVLPGMSYMVGERGPELFQPNTSGSIVANDDMSMRGGTTIIQNIQTPTLGDFRQSRRQLARDARRATA